MTRIPPPEGEADLLGHRPEIKELWEDLGQALLFSGRLNPRLKYQVQMALALRGGCPWCHSMVKPIGDYDAREGVAVAFAELLQADSSSINQGHFDVLAESFSPPEIVELCVLVAVLIAGLKLGEIFDEAPASTEDRDQYADMVAGLEAEWHRSSATVKKKIL
jgi:alkylhydroperoxidase family enzyme